MSQTLLFSLKEGLAGFRRSRLAGIVAITTIAISLILIGIFLIITDNLNRLVDNLRKRVELEVFLPDSVNELKIQELGELIRGIDGVKEVNFISKEMAILDYKELFKDQEIDYLGTLGYNPLPASFRIKLQPGYNNAANAEAIAGKIAKVAEINKEDVIFRREYLVILEKYIEIAIAINLIVGIIVCLSAILLVSNHIRLNIHYREKIISTMKLVGATPFLIKMPLYIQGILQGLFAGILASIVLYGILKVANIEIPGYIQVNWHLYFLLWIVGVALGIGGSYLAIRRHLKY